MSFATRPSWIKERQPEELKNSSALELAAAVSKLTKILTTAITTIEGRELDKSSRFEI